MKNIKGFSVIEAIIAIMLIAVVAVASFEFFKYCMIFTVDTELKLMAVNSAREAMEKVYMDPDPESALSEEVTLAPGHVWDRKVTVTPETDYKVVTVTIVPQPQTAE